MTATVCISPTSHSQLNPAHFACPQPLSPLPPHSSQRLPLTFSPTLPSPHSVFAFFEVKTQGGLSTSTIKCTGVAKGEHLVLLILRKTAYVHTSMYVLSSSKGGYRRQYPELWKSAMWKVNNCNTACQKLFGCNSTLTGMPQSPCLLRILSK